ncbi:sensor histidine kinase [Bifidobacterium callitrichos]|uniref:histidine kinase n=1 Tax=Bifidobacterium callitrichos DSM 23973 TaxID=1437609 RepID=A0A087A2X1_9BIFI|nr:HAMP domain-containing sensor histidine kinase [Bifidobacterium callitrichos]KFI53121.1 histidine kinase [Bifidobacterium callitrichos DSM 23973]
MKKLEYPSLNENHSSHPKPHLPFQWSTRRRLVTTIVIAFFMLTGVVTAMTYYVVNRQLETVTVNKSFTQAEEADEQHSLNSQAIPPEADKDYVSAGYDSSKDALTLTMEQGDKITRDLILAISIAPIIAFGLLSGGITWIITTKTQRRINSVASQITASDAGLERQPIVISYENDEAYTIASAYNLMLEDLNNAIAREKEFIANASHELKNPLAATYTALEIPLHNHLFDKQCQPFVEKALESNRSGAEIVNHLLELSKIQQLDLTDLSRIDISEIIRIVLHENEELITEDIQILVDLENVHILADRLLIKQMVTNLISNSIQHNQPIHPQIWVKVCCNGTYEGKTYAMLQISNTGIDLSNTNMDELLSPFNRGNGNRINIHTEPTTKHHGLGLSIVKEIVMMHHGHLVMHPRRGGGLEVTVFLPVSPMESYVQ